MHVLELSFKKMRIYKVKKQLCIVFLNWVASFSKIRNRKRGSDQLLDAFCGKLVKRESDQTKVQNTEQMKKEKEKEKTTTFCPHRERKTEREREWGGGNKMSISFKMRSHVVDISLPKRL